MLRARTRLQGLCHDLGHGPFSHVFDTEFLPRRLGSHHHADLWYGIPLPVVLTTPSAPLSLTHACRTHRSHEQMSADMLNYLVDVNHLSVDQTVVKRVCELITSGHPDPTATGGPSACASNPGANRHPQFLRDIVANGRNSVDVDKFDYIQRDCQNCGIKSSSDFGRLMQYMKVIEDEICFKASEVLNVYELFHTRASLHQRVYSHRKAKAIEYMVVDALVHADAAWGNEISNAIWRAQDFVKLDDTVLKRIEWSEEAALEPARALLRRLRRRELYRFVNEFTVPSERLDRWVDVKPQDIVSCQDAKGGRKLVAEDIIVHNLKIDWAMKNKNPVDSVHFYQDYSSDTKFTIPKEKVSLLIPDVFLERKVRVYSKSDLQEDVAAVDAAFAAYQQREFQMVRQVGSTPLKASRKRPLDLSGAGALGSQFEGGGGTPQSMPQGAAAE